jgi:predicted DNA-binding helix-hairpin-helix protein
MGTYISKSLDSTAKLKVLGMDSKFDVCGYPSIFKRKRPLRFHFIYPAVGEGGRCVRLFKVLQTNACQGNCFYCANRRDRNFLTLEGKFFPKGRVETEARPDEQLFLWEEI